MGKGGCCGCCTSLRPGELQQTAHAVQQPVVWLPHRPFTWEFQVQDVTGSQRETACSARLDCKLQRRADVLPTQQTHQEAGHEL